MIEAQPVAQHVVVQVGRIGTYALDGAGIEVGIVDAARGGQVPPGLAARIEAGPAVAGSKGNTFGAGGLGQQGVVLSAAIR